MAAQPSTDFMSNDCHESTTWAKEEGLRLLAEYPWILFTGNINQAPELCSTGHACLVYVWDVPTSRRDAPRRSGSRFDLQTPQFKVRNHVAAAAAVSHVQPLFA
ncbi:hypothetical protein J6590_012324 [Homalodisca vitripennis]|nr:hypothetical protein J6590_012324 [Homalodisca vitripennis]